MYIQTSVYGSTIDTDVEFCSFIYDMKMKNTLHL